MNHKNLRIIFIVISLTLMVTIFCFSSQNADDSSDTSDPITRFICGILYPDFEDIDFTERNEILNKISFFVRKTAHFSIYFALGTSLFIVFNTFDMLNTFIKIIFAWGICILYSISDEIHQYFVPGRSCELRDVCIDSSGALIAILLCVLVIKFFRYKKSNKGVVNDA